MKAVKLKPCPFCGGKADFKTYIGACVYVECRKCRTTSDVFDKTDFLELNCIAAADAWNRRAENECSV